MRHTPIIAIIGSLLALAACGAHSPSGNSASSPQPQPTETPQTSTAPKSTTATTRPTPPAMPEAARRHTRAGAEAFTKHYWAVVNYAQTSLDSKPLAKLSDGSCGGCRGVIHAVDALRRAHAVVAGGANAVVDFHGMATPAADGTTWFECRYKIQAPPEEIDYPRPKKDKRYPGGTARGSMSLRPVTRGWLIDRLDVTQ